MRAITEFTSTPAGHTIARQFSWKRSKGSGQGRSYTGQGGRGRAREQTTRYVLWAISQGEHVGRSVGGDHHGEAGWDRMTVPVLSRPKSVSLYCIL
jgi:hypothetical protein